jgi:hypothetical protein
LPDLSSTLFPEVRRRVTGNGGHVCRFLFDPGGMRLSQRDGRFIFLMEGTGFIGPARGKARLFPRTASGIFDNPFL